MKYHYFLFRIFHLNVLFGAMSLMLSAQTLSPTVISSGGNFYQNAALSLAQTVGELSMTKTFFNNLILTQGFHQSEIIISEVNSFSEEIIDFGIYPNPSDDFIYISSLSSHFDDCTIEIYDLMGRRIYNYMFKGSDQGLGKIKINTSEWISGRYILTIRINKNNKYRLANGKIFIQHP